MSRPTRQQLAHMTREEKIIDFNSRMQEKLDEVQHSINASRAILYNIQLNENEFIDFTIDDEFIENVLKLNVIKYYRKAYAYRLCLMRVCMNIISNTLTVEQFDATHEKMTELLEIKFEVFGMKHHLKWSKDAIENFDDCKLIYTIYKYLHNIN